MVTFASLKNSWSQENYKRSVIFVLLSQILLLFSIISIGFLYVHVSTPNYNLKRLSKFPLVCSSVEDKVLESSECELPPDPSKVTFSMGRRLFEDDFTSTIALGSNRRERRFGWSSCGEFCDAALVDSVGCRRVRVGVRKGGSEFKIMGCTSLDVIDCPFLNEDEKDFVKEKSLKLGIFQCNKNLDCKRVEKVLSCDLGESFDGEKFNCTERNANLNSSECFRQEGLYICDMASSCRKIEAPEKVCARNCEKRMALEDKNLIVADGSWRKIFAANCSKAWKFLGNKNVEVWPRGIKHQNNEKWKTQPPLMVSCNGIKVENGSDGEITLHVKDCFNGTRLESSTWPPSLNLKELQNLWALNLQFGLDFALDPINELDAPPTSILTLSSSTPLYLADFYKNGGAGCDLLGQTHNPKLCPDFYSRYAKLADDLRGQSEFPCYCREVNGPPLMSSSNNGSSSSLYCVVGDMSTLPVFDRSWEDGLVEFLGRNYTVAMIFLGLIFGSSLTCLVTLLWPLIADLNEGKELNLNKKLVVVGVTPRASLRGSPEIRDENKDKLFIVSGSGLRREGVQMEIRRSRSGSIASVM